jgi:DNA modification methylase
MENKRLLNVGGGNNISAKLPLVLAEFMHVLKDGGFAYVSVPDINLLWKPLLIVA